MSADKQASHTALPWEVFIGGMDGDLPGIEAPAAEESVVIFGNRKVDSCGVQGKTDEEAFANAEFIVRAVNAFYPLVEALKHTADCLEAELGDRGDDSLSEEELMSWLGKEYGRQTIAARIRLKQARAALKLTEASE